MGKPKNIFLPLKKNKICTKTSSHPPLPEISNGPSLESVINSFLLAIGNCLKHIPQYTIHLILPGLCGPVQPPPSPPPSPKTKSDATTCTMKTRKPAADFNPKGNLHDDANLLDYYYNLCARQFQPRSSAGQTRIFDAR